MNRLTKAAVTGVAGIMLLSGLPATAQQPGTSLTPNYVSQPQTAQLLMVDEGYYQQPTHSSYRIFDNQDGSSESIRLAAEQRLSDEQQSYGQEYNQEYNQEYGGASGQLSDCGQESRCGNCDCYQNSCDCGPRLSANLGWMFLIERQDPGGQPLARAGTSGTGPVLLDTANIGMSETDGMDLSLAYRLDCDYSLEGRALVFEDQHGRAASGLLQTGQQFTIATDPTPFTVLSPFVFVADYESQFQSFELNLTRRMCYWKLLCGVRHIAMDESLFINGNFTPGIGGFSMGGFATDNDLYGGQLGAEGTLLTFCDGMLSIDFMGKAGVYYNHASSVFTGDFINPAVATDRADEVAFLGEAGLYGTVQVTQRLAVRAGYQAMYLDGLALANKQVPASSQLGAGTPTTNTQTNGDLWYGGAVISIMGTY